MKIGTNDSLESRIYRIGEAIIANGSMQKVFSDSCNGIEDSLGIAIDIFKERMVFLQKDLKQKDAIINFLQRN